MGSQLLSYNYAVISAVSKIVFSPSLWAFYIVNWSRDAASGFFPDIYITRVLQPIAPLKSPASISFENMMLKNVLYVFSALLASTTVTAQCGNAACTLANSLYTECKYSYTTVGDFQKCLCTNKFLVNYGRCLSGTICAWDGTGPLNTPCVKIYCPGTFAGGFDAVAFCSGSSSTSLNTCHEIVTD